MPAYGAAQPTRGGFDAKYADVLPKSRPRCHNKNAGFLKLRHDVGAELGGGGGVCDPAEQLEAISAGANTFPKTCARCHAKGA